MLLACAPLCILCICVYKCVYAYIYINIYVCVCVYMVFGSAASNPLAEWVALVGDCGDGDPALWTLTLPRLYCVCEQ